MDNEPAIGALVNDENAKLEDKLKLKLKYLNKLKEYGREQDKQIENLEEHQRNLVQNLDYNHEVIRATENDLRSQSNLIHVKNNEKTYNENQIKKMKLEIEDMQNNCIYLEKWLVGQKRKLDDLQEVVSWETDSWQEWLQRTYANEKNNLTITIMLGQDATLIKDLGLKLEKLSLKALNWKKMKEEAFNDQLVARMELKRNTTEFGIANEQRRNILKLWDESIEEMERRDSRLISLGKELELIKNRVDTLNKVAQTKTTEFAEELKNKENLEGQLDLLNCAMLDLKNHLSQYGPQSELEMELEAIINKVKNLSLDERNLRMSIFKIKDEFAKRNQILANLKEIFKTTEQEYNYLTEKTISVDLKLTLSKSMMNQEEKFFAKLNKDLIKMKEVCSTAERKLQQLTEKYRTIQSRLQSTHATGRELSADITKIDAKEQNFKNTLQELSWKENDLDGRWALMRGSFQRSVGETDLRLNNELKTTREVRDEKLRHNQCLRSNLNKTLDEIKKFTGEFDQSKLIHNKLEKEASDLDKSLEILQNSLHKDGNKKQEMMVESCLLQVSIRRLQISVEQITDFISKTELLMLEVQNNLQEKISMGEECSKNFRLQKNRLMEEKQLLASNLQKCLTKLKAVKSRHDVLYNVNEGISSDPEKLVQRAEKKKLSLETKDRDIEDLITKTDREIQALRNSLDLFEKSNSALRNKTIAPSEEVKSEVRELERRLQNLYTELYNKQSCVKQVQGSLAGFENHLQNLKINCNIDVELKDVLQKVDYLYHHSQEQEIKLCRAENKIGKLIHDKKNQPTEAQKNDVTLKLLSELKNNIDNNIQEILSMQPETDAYFSCESKTNMVKNRTYTKE